MKINTRGNSSRLKLEDVDESKPAKAVEEPSNNDGDFDTLTSAEKTPLRLYLNDIGKIPLLTPGQEIKLAAKIKKGCNRSRDLMVKSNLRLVVKIASDYTNFGLPFLDLINEGNIGLMKAVERFDPDKGGKLSTYAAWWIKQSIKRALANQSKTIRLPVHLVEKISHMRKIENEYQDKLKRDPSIEELSFAMSLPINKVAHLKTMSIRPASLDIRVGDDETTSLGELIGDDSSDTPSEQFENKTILDDLHHIIDRLGNREATVIKMRFGLNGERPKTLEEVGLALGLTRERVRQLQFITLRRLKEIIKEYERQRTEDDIAKERVEIERAHILKEFIMKLEEKKKGLNDRKVEERRD